MQHLQVTAATDAYNVVEYPALKFKVSSLSPYECEYGIVSDVHVVMMYVFVASGDGSFES